MKYNYSKLNGLIVEKFGTQACFAKAMGLSERTISLKLNSKVYWTQKEIELACELLGIDRKDIATYFFTTIVQYA